MSVLEIAYFMSTNKLSNKDYNRLLNLIKQADREDLFKLSFAEVKENIFKELENEIRGE